MPDIVYTYTLTFRAPVGVFTGLGIAGMVDRTIVRDAAGLPYIPGSSVKGRLRFFAERLLNAATLPSVYSIHAPGHALGKTLHDACTLCRLFGNPAIPGLLQVGQATPHPPWNTLFQQLLQTDPNPVLHPDTELRPGLALSRLRRTALANHLFFDETVPPITFTGQCLVDARVTPAERHFLRVAGGLVDAIGSRKATGRGRLEGGIQLMEATS